MSYEIVKSIKFNKKENCIEVNCASNNLRPLHWSKAKYQKENWRETMKVFLRDMIGREIQPLASCNKYKIYYAMHELKKYQPYIENEDIIWNREFNKDNKYVYVGKYDQTNEEENWDKIIAKFEELYNENDTDKYLLKNIRYGEFKNYEVKRNRLRTKNPEAQDKYTAYYNMTQTKYKSIK